MIAGIPGVGLTHKGVESCLHRLTERLKKKVSGRPSAKEFGADCPS
jgi:hypothetical protein